MTRWAVATTSTLLVTYCEVARLVAPSASGSAGGCSDAGLHTRPQPRRRHLGIGQPALTSPRLRKERHPYGLPQRLLPELRCTASPTCHRLQLPDADLRWSQSGRRATDETDASFRHPRPRPRRDDDLGSEPPGRVPRADDIPRPDGRLRCTHPTQPLEQHKRCQQKHKSAGKNEGRCGEAPKCKRKHKHKKHKHH